jgi:phosphoserine phosphatase
MLAAFVASTLLCALAARAQAPDPLPSWHDGTARKAIVEFVQATTAKGSPAYVEPADRIAVFDNDGTLWAEQPMYFQVLFMIDQLNAAAPRHPEWKDNAAFRALAAHDEGALAGMQKELLQLLAVANSGMTVGEYEKSIRDWLGSARHPKFDRPYTDLVYLPMQELLAYLRGNGYKTFIVSGGGIEFMRPWVEKAYGIPPEQVVGSVLETRFEIRDGKPALVREPKVDFVDDGPGKPVGIYRAIGHRPVAAFGNSDGDLQMLQFTAAGDGRRLMVIVHHDDAAREFAYDRESKVGKLDKAWDEAKEKGWVVVSVKDDWKKVFAFQ